MRRTILWPIVLGLLGFGLFFTSVAMAAPHQPLTAPAETITLFQATVTPTVAPPTPVTPTTPSTSTHPVASAMAKYFDVPYSEIAALHQEGYGFGVIAHAYFIAQNLGGITPTELLAEFSSGVGWGEILKEYGLHPGRAGRGGNLGDIMSGRGRNNQSPDSLGADHTPPGQLKNGKGQSSDEGDNDDGSHGRGRKKQK